MAGPKKPYRAWRGALELTVGGVPLPVNVELYARVKKSRNESFRNLGPDGQPAVTTSNACQKGVSLGKGQFAVMTEEALEALKNLGEKTTVMRPMAFADVDTIALDLAIDRFAVRPDDRVEAADQALNIVWNGLRATKKAYVSQASLTSGHDSVLVLYADDQGLWAAMLPFEDELYPFPTHEFEENDQAAELFAEMIEDEHADKVGPFDHSAFVSQYRIKRQATIDAVIAGQKVEPIAAPEEAKPTVDLMDLLSKASAKKAKADKKTTTKKVAA
jgi:non-homologous end joining protein Ku